MSVAPPQLDRYIAVESPVHGADHRAKTVLALAFIGCVTSLPPGAWWSLALFAIVVWGGAFVSHVGLLRLFRRTLVAVPFVLVAVPSVFTRPGTPIFELSVGPATFTASDHGVAFLLTLIAKSWLAVTAAALLISTTRFGDVMSALAWLRLPRLLLAVMAGMYRYLHVLVAEAVRMMTARASRSASTPGRRSGGSLMWRASVTGHMAGSLFIRTLDRSERVHMAMLARGYDGTPISRATSPISASLVLLTGLSVLLMAASATAARIM